MLDSLLHSSNQSTLKFRITQNMTMLAERPLKCNLYNSRIYVAASLNGNVDVAKILIENGADVNKKDKIKRSALMVMLYSQHNVDFPFYYELL